MATLKTKVTSEGSIALPEELQEALGIRPGSSVDFVEMAPGRYEIVAAKQSIQALKGILKSDGPILSVEEMNEMIAECVAASDSRSRLNSE